MGCLQGGALFFLVSFSLLPAQPAAHGNGATYFVDERDREIAELARAAATDRCTGDFDGGSWRHRRPDLEDIVGDHNFLLESLRQADSPRDAAVRMARHMRTDLIIQRSSALVVGILLFFLYWCFCWSVCPVATLCQCLYQKGFSHTCRYCVSVTLIACITGVVLAALATRPGYDSCSAGFTNSACSTAQMLDVMLSGQPHQRQPEQPQQAAFVGIVPMLELLIQLEEDLKSESTLITRVEGILDSSAEIESALQVADGTVGLLTSMVQFQWNVRPRSSANDTLMHVCKLCQGLLPPAQRLAQAIKEGIAATLASTRAEVMLRLDSSVRFSTRHILRSSRESIAEFKNAARESLGHFLEPGYFQNIKEQVDTNLWYATHFFLVHATVLLGLSALATCLLGSHQICLYVPARWLACWAWECGCLFVIPMLIIGGFMQALTHPLAGLCLMMEDVNSQMLQDISGGLGVNMSADRGVIVGDLVDQCFANLTGSASLMDITYGRDPVTGEKAFLKDTLVHSIHEPLKESFAQLTTMMEGGKGWTTEALEFEAVALRALLAGNPADALMLPDEESMRRHPVFGDLQPFLEVGYATSCSCANFTVVGELGEVSNQSFPGVDNFRMLHLELGTKDSSDTTGGCLQRVTCDRSLSPDLELACVAGNAVLNLKAALADPAARAFRCDLFENPDGTICDPLNMTHDGSEWRADCLRPSGQGKHNMRVKERFCTLHEFTVYLQEFDERLRRAMLRLGTATNQAVVSIDAELRELVQSHIGNSIAEISNGSSCEFMAKLYHETIDQLCYRGVWGFRFIGNSFALSGMLISLMVVVMYFAWRLARNMPPPQQDDAESGAQDDAESGAQEPAGV